MITLAVSVEADICLDRLIDISPLDADILLPVVATKAAQMTLSRDQLKKIVFDHDTKISWLKCPDQRLISAFDWPLFNRRRLTLRTCPMSR